MGHLRTRLLCIFVALSLDATDAHAFLARPPSRNLIRNIAGEETCPHCLQGGGPPNVKAKANGHWPDREAIGSHGLCGDPGQNAPEYASPAQEPHMVPSAPGATYTAGQVVEFEVHVNAHHMGHYEFRLCAGGLDGTAADFTVQAGQDCLDQHVLQRAPLDPSCSDGSTDPDCQPIDPLRPGRWYIPPLGHGHRAAYTAEGTADWSDDMVDTSRSTVAVEDTHKMKYVIPPGLNGPATIQFYWSTGNSCMYDGRYWEYFQNLFPGHESWCPKCYKQWEICSNTCCGVNDLWAEEFWNCADVVVLPGSEPPATTQPHVGTSTSAPATVATTTPSSTSAAGTSPPATEAPVTTHPATQPPGEACVQNPDCVANPWCNDPAYTAWCAARTPAACPTPQCTVQSSGPSPEPEPATTLAPTPEPTPEVTIAPTQPPTAPATTQPGAIVECDNGEGSCKDMCSKECKNAVATNQCWGTPRYIHCACSDGTMHAFDGCPCEHASCPDSPSPTAEPTTVPTTPAPTAPPTTRGPTAAPSTAPPAQSTQKPPPQTGSRLKPILDGLIPPAEYAASLTSDAAKFRFLVSRLGTGADAVPLETMRQYMDAIETVAASTYPRFLAESKLENNQRELCSFLNIINWETDFTTFEEGLCAGNAGTNPKCNYIDSTVDYEPGKQYYGRGPKQLSWNYNYKEYSQFYFGDDRLLANPELVYEDFEVMWGSAMWFWMSDGKAGATNYGGFCPPQAVWNCQERCTADPDDSTCDCGSPAHWIPPGKSSPHDAIHDDSKNDAEKLLSVVNIVNGGYDCCPTTRYGPRGTSRGHTKDRGMGYTMCIDLFGLVDSSAPQHFEGGATCPVVNDQTENCPDCSCYSCSKIGSVWYMPWKCEASTCSGSLAQESTNISQLAGVHVHGHAEGHTEEVKKRTAKAKKRNLRHRGLLDDHDGASVMQLGVLRGKIDDLEESDELEGVDELEESDELKVSDEL